MQNTNGRGTRDQVMIIPGRHVAKETLEMMIAKIVNYTPQVKILVLGSHELRSGVQATIVNSFDPKVIKEHMSKSRYAIAAGGQILNELAVMGVPVIAFESAIDQRVNIEGFEESGFILNAGHHKDEKFSENLDNAFKTLLGSGWIAKASRLGMKLVDAKGAERVVSFTLNSIK